MKNDWKTRDAAAKRAKVIKAAMLRDLSGRIEKLWTACNEQNAGYTTADRKAVADAGHSIRSIIGGWNNRR